MGVLPIVPDMLPTPTSESDRDGEKMKARKKPPPQSPDILASRQQATEGATSGIPSKCPSWLIFWTVLKIFITSISLFVVCTCHGIHVKVREQHGWILPLGGS